MNEKINERKKAAQREYFRRWRAEHPEAVQAAQMRYWMKKAERLKQTQANVEIRQEAAQ